VDRAKELARAAVDNMRDTPPPFTVHDANSKHHTAATTHSSSSTHRHNSSSSSADVAASSSTGGCVHNGQYYKAGECSGNCAADPLRDSTYNSGSGSRRKQHEYSDSYSNGEYTAAATGTDDEMVGMSLDDDADCCCDDSSTVNSSSHHTAPLSPPEQFRRRRSRSEACHQQQQQLSPSPPPLSSSTASRYSTSSSSGSGGGALRRVSALQGWSDSLDTTAAASASATGITAATAGGSRYGSGSERGANSSDEETVGWCTSASRQQARRTGVYRSDVSGGGDSECASPLGFWAESMSDIDARNKNRPVQPWCDETAGSGVRSKRGSSSSSASSASSSSSTTADSSSATGSSGTASSHHSKAKLGGSALRRESAVDDAGQLQHCADDERSEELQQQQRSDSSAVDEACEELAGAMSMLTTTTATAESDVPFNGCAADRWSCSTAEDDSSTTATASSSTSSSDSALPPPAAPVLAPLPRFQGGARDWKQARSYASSCSSSGKQVSYAPALQRVQESAPTSSSDVVFSSCSSTGSSAAAGSAVSANTGTIDSTVGAGGAAVSVQQSAMQGTPADVTTATAATAGDSTVTFSTATTAADSGTTTTTVASAVPASLSMPVKFVRSYSYHGLRSEALYDSPARRRSKLTISQRRRQGENSEAFKERFFRFLGVLIQVSGCMLLINSIYIAIMHVLRLIALQVAVFRCNHIV
jgi:trimeric autotransporter adhesin